MRPSVGRSHAAWSKSCRAPSSIVSPDTVSGGGGACSRAAARTEAGPAPVASSCSRGTASRSAKPSPGTNRISVASASRVNRSPSSIRAPPSRWPASSWPAARCSAVWARTTSGWATPSVPVIRTRAVSRTTSEPSAVSSRRTRTGPKPARSTSSPRPTVGAEPRSYLGSRNDWWGDGRWPMRLPSARYMPSIHTPSARPSLNVTPLSVRVNSVFPSASVTRSPRCAAVQAFG